jgi:hypothetical protein
VRIRACGAGEVVVMSRTLTIPSVSGETCRRKKKKSLVLNPGITFQRNRMVIVAGRIDRKGSVLPEFPIRWRD